ncbi:MAG: choice-of-anchor Q domain-containing protein [Candidatus Cloacimonadaceae bacterium]|nr:choice-of-anchor Q domain-containing protein [Candidatus Cloacimonadaceae bacterium]
MKKRLILLLCMLPALVMCTTRTVSLDGTQQYTTIQSAVDVSIHGDSILVYPGRYVENINLIRQSISIASLYSLDPQQSYMDNTIIDGNLGTCVRVINGETITLNGFTLVNNENGYYGSPINPGGGVDVRNYSSAIVSNCIIRDCIAQSGGGIGVGSHSNLSLSNVKILDNQALRLGGGIAFDESVTLFFDPVALCSVYNNTATIGMDISLSFHYETQNSYNVHLLRGSSVLSEPDGYFVGVRNCNVTLDIQEGYITQIDSDLYVSPNGDDANTGLSAESPMQSIVYAMQRIASNSANHRTIHLAEGIYSNSNNNQLFPAGVKSHVRVIGAGMDDTVLDCEFLRTAWGAWYANDIEIANMKIVNCRSSYTFPLGVYYGSDIYLHDLKFENNWGANFSAMTIGYCDNIIIENIIAGYTTYDNDLMTLGAFDCDNLLVSNFISANNTVTDWESNDMGFRFQTCDLVLRNSIIANNTAQDAWPFFYTNIYPGFEDFNLDMSNVLIINNTISNCGWVNNPIYIQNRFQPMQINNCTFANNNTNATLTSIIGGAEIRNLITYNPGTPYELYLMNYISSIGMSYEASISNSLFRSGTVGSSLPDLVTLTDNIMNSDPLFLGTVDTNLSVDQPEYYQLSSLSPCIDSGTPDTTGLNLPQMDLAGNWRIWNDRIDMGCYEYGSEPYVGIDDPASPPPPDRISISAYPNPLFNTSKAAGVFIEFTLPGKPAAEPVLEIYNVRGQKVKTMRLTESYNSLIHKAGLAGDVKQNGEFYSTVWNGKDDQNRPLASGTYIVKVRADRMVATIKITIIK